MCHDFDSNTKKGVRKQISRIFKDREVEHASKKPRPKSQQIPSERLLVSYDTFLEKMKKYESVNEMEKQDHHHWFKSISKAKKWRKRRFTNPFHHNEKEDKPPVPPHNLDLLDRFIKPSKSEKANDTKPRFSTCRQQKCQHIRIEQQPELSEKIEIGSSIPISYSTQSLYPLPSPVLCSPEEIQPRSSTSLSYNSIFSKSTPHLTSWASDQDTVRTSFTSHEEDKHSFHSIVISDTCHLQQQQSSSEQNLNLYACDYEVTDKRRFGLAEQVKAILGDAISIADLELELGILTQT
ncbi:hypothetical protein K501DRAFT_277363 [Backusella circina FSU 941]|nr:hypothetical protein K501DRAFT_277363 [Backusella circina FSU 941]